MYLIMANHSHQTHVLCLHSLMLCKRFGLSFLIKNLNSLWDPSLLSFTNQFDKRLSIHMKSSLLHCHFSSVMSTRWNRDVLPCRRFFSGAFSGCRCIFRLITGVCPLTQRYGGFTWVFDPGINGCVNLPDGIIRDPIGYVSQTVLGLSFILNMPVISERFGVEYACTERVNGLLVGLILSDDSDVFPLLLLEYFIVQVNCMGCGAFGLKIKVKFFSDVDDGDVMGRIKKACDCEGDVLYFPWWKNSTFMERKIMTIDLQRCVRRFHHIVWSFKRQKSESFQATFQSFSLTKVMRKAFGVSFIR